MFIFIGSRRQTYLLRHARGDSRRPRWTGRTYHWLFRTRRLPAATYVFVGVDRLDSAERRLAASFYRHINSLGSGWRALNDPAIAMGRYRLLRSLHEAGINDFNAYLATEPLDDVAFPCFIRSSTTSRPPLTGLLTNAADLANAIENLVAAAHPKEDLLVIEYCAESARDGVYRKQAEYRVADRYVPNPSIYAGEWYVKVSNTISVPEALLDFDRQVVATNPMGEVARRAFEIAGIEYGRADIGIVNGRPQIYEINFNPDIRTQHENPNANPILGGLWSQCEQMLFEAMRAVDSTGSGSMPTLRTSELTAFRLRFWRNYAPQRY